MPTTHRYRPRRSTAMLCGATAWALLCAAAPPPRYATRCATDRLSYYEGRVVADSGAAVGNATITVHPTAVPLGVASIFADAAGQTPLANPLQTDGLGRYRFYVATGTYNVDVQSGTVTTTLVSVPIVDPRRPQTVQGSDDAPAITLAQPSTGTPADGDPALTFERVRADGSRVYGPVSFRVNDESAAGGRSGTQWLYNADWNESTHSAGSFVVPDMAFRIEQTAIGAQAAGGQTQPFSFGFEVAPAGAPPAVPQFTTVWQHAQTKILGGTTLVGRSKVGGSLVVGDGLENSSLVARRLGWIDFDTTAPAGVLAPVVGPVQTSPGVAEPILPGDVVVSVSDGAGYSLVTRTTSPSQSGASVFISGGNGSYPSTLMTGKALVRLAPGATVTPGDVLVSSSTVGRATVDNSVTDGRRIVGFATEAAHATLQGFVAMVRVSR